MIVGWVLVRVLVALLKEETLFLFKKQQAPEQAPTAKMQYVVVKTTCLAKWEGRLWVLVRSTSTLLRFSEEGEAQLTPRLIWGGPVSVGSTETPGISE